MTRPQQHDRQNQFPPKQAMLQLMMLRIKTQQMHQLLNTTLNQVTEAFNAQDIPSVLLKGCKLPLNRF